MDTHEIGPARTSRVGGPSLRARAFEHDVFIVHAEADERFVRGYLILELGLPPERALLLGELELGQVIVEQIQHRVRASRLTIVVLSPAYRAERWAVFGEQLAAHARIALDDGRLVLPLLRADCDVPDDIAMLVGLDFRESQRETWSAQAVRLRELLGRPAPVEAALPCPYPGMRPFTEKDAARFFGRNDELDDLLGRLERGEREIYVIGASGSGKSSLVAAGLLPRLNQHGAGGVLVRSLRPGERPVARLAQLLEAELAAPDAIEAAIGALLARHPPASWLLLVVDQLEELFSVAVSDERAAFQDAVRALRADPLHARVHAARGLLWRVHGEHAVDRSRRPDLARRAGRAPR